MKTLPAIRASAAIRAMYERRLLELIDEMHDSIAYWMSARWREHRPDTVLYGQDASPVDDIAAALDDLAKRWNGRFDDLADKLATYFAKQVGGRCDRQMMADLRKAGFTVRFKVTRAMRQTLKAVVEENVNLIRSISEHHFTQVRTIVMQGVSRGGDLKSITDGLMKQTGVTRRRAVNIARDQNNKAMASVRAAREADLGITEGIWMHSGGGKHPRATHKAFNGKRFKLAEGVDFGDGFGKVIPGEAINCRCTWRAVLPF